jgi:uncharacterized circularly permuted ATP-grasp superfamily protein
VTESSASGSNRAFDEMHEAGGVRAAYAGIAQWIESHGLSALATKRAEAEALFPPGGHHLRRLW